MFLASLGYSNIVLDQDMNDSFVSAERYVNNSRMKIEWHMYGNHFCQMCFASL
jgi:hypothetical protein